MGTTNSQVPIKVTTAQKTDTREISHALLIRAENRRCRSISISSFFLKSFSFIFPLLQIYLTLLPRGNYLFDYNVHSITVQKLCQQINHAYIKRRAFYSQINAVTQFETIFQFIVTQSVSVVKSFYRLISKDRHWVPASAQLFSSGW